MKDIESIIKQQRGQFGSEEPPKGHFDRFSEKLRLQEESKTIWQWKNLMKVAAVVAFVVIAGLTSYQLREINSPHYSLGQLSPEYQEVEDYFTTSINHQLEIIKQLTNSTDTQEQNTIKEELAGMDQLYKQLEKELQANPKDERVIQAMIEHFQVKNNILSRIVEQLYLVSEQNLQLADILRI